MRQMQCSRTAVVRTDIKYNRIIWMYQRILTFDLSAYILDGFKLKVTVNIHISKISRIAIPNGKKLPFW